MPYACLAADGRCAAPAARWRLCFAPVGVQGAAAGMQRAARRAGAAGAGGGCCAYDWRVRGCKAVCSSGVRGVQQRCAVLRLSVSLVTRLVLLLTRTTLSQTRACAGHAARAFALAHASRRRRLAKARVRRKILQHASAGPEVAREALRPLGWALLYSPASRAGAALSRSPRAHRAANTRSAPSSTTQQTTLPVPATASPRCHDARRAQLL